ncbi:hypothetical protein SMACR_00403 [Sordaria macrospora]|uniref:Short-chain dehydrogenase/reductase 3 n=2 Tax=Sordaria macrospora TaxID=5147 RepID=F7VL08_SORMK|nr:uncharacterized protein SMAC_00403 [Sordaria macrospora k-hell]KAA8632628.1 hypothetical protein SMACR_00403 [Sordaria macrospora]WPJ59148.1 hypothetical protein SMAC4_00403 [Sordaria macrospora]CCC06185.1 unnamed protein product [Sordaria macrospora k-hell]
MPFHNGLLPREGFKGDTLISLIGKTAFNAKLLLPLFLAAKYTKRGQDLSILHPTAFKRIKTLLILALIGAANRYLNRRVLNNGVSDTYDWAREIVLITGGAGGIGGEMVKLFAEKGVRVVVLDIQPLTFNAGQNVHYFKCDLTNRANVASVAQEVRKKVGDPTVLINNAGVVQGRTVLETTEKDLRFTFDVNLFAHYYTSQEFLPYMIKRNHGMVVTVASFASWVCVPNMVDYAASKAAALSFHQGLTAELQSTYKAPKVRTIVVNQGYTRTPLFEGYQNDSPFMMPPLEPATVAEAVVRKVLTGESGQVVVPKTGNIISALAAFPLWYQTRLRAKNVTIMSQFKGRKVVKDLDTFYEGREKGKDAKGGDGPEASTVLV